MPIFEVVLWVIDNPNNGAGHPEVFTTEDLDRAVKLLCRPDVEDGGISTPDVINGVLVAGKEKGHGIEWFNGWSIKGKVAKE